MLRRALNARIGPTGLSAGYVVKLWTAAACAAIAAWVVKLSIPPMHPVLVAILVLGPYGLMFCACSFALRIPEAQTALARLRR